MSCMVQPPSTKFGPMATFINYVRLEGLAIYFDFINNITYILINVGSKCFIRLGCIRFIVYLSF
jgi:hypothetical protein